MTSDEVNRLAEKMELALHRKRMGEYQTLRATVYGHDRLAVDWRVRFHAQQRRDRKRAERAGFGSMARAFAQSKKLTLAALLLAALSSAHAGDKEKHEQKQQREVEPNYIYRRQQAGLVEGTPIRSFYVAHRRIDFYRDGSAFEKDARVK